MRYWVCIGEREQTLGATHAHVPFLKGTIGWWWAFAVLRVLAMLRPKSSPGATRIAGGRG